MHSPAVHDTGLLILGLVARFVEFELPPWRKRGECAKGIRADVERHHGGQPAGTHVLVAEDAQGVRVGFLHLQTVTDYVTTAQNCHIADLAVAPGCDGRGIGSALLAWAERWARERHAATRHSRCFPATNAPAHCTSATATASTCCAWQRR